MRFLFLLVIAIAVIAPTPALADEAGTTTIGHRRVVLVGMPDAVFTATAAALGPWTISVEASAEPGPADATAPMIAVAHDATAVAWLEDDTLVIYDHLRGVSERRPAQLPVDDISAAAMALSIKTALRRPVVVVVEPPLDEPEIIIKPPPPVIVIVPPRERRVHISGRLGVGVPLTRSIEPLLAVAVGVAIDLPRAGGLAATAQLGGAWQNGIAGAGFAGDFAELRLGAGVELRLPLRSSFMMIPSGQVIVHAGRLAGTLDPERAVSASAQTVGFELGLALDQQVGPIRVGGLATAEVLAEPTRYQVGGIDVLVVPRFALGLAFRVSY